MTLQELDDEVSEVISSCWSDNTLRTRSSQWKRFFEFCEMYSMSPLPASDRTVVRFLLFQSKTSKYVTVNNYLSAINSLHKFYGFDTDFRDSFFVKMFLHGLQNTLGKQVDQKKPLTVEHLQHIYVKLDFSNINNVTLWCATVLCFRSLLRKSNIVPFSADEDLHCICRGDVSFGKKGVTLNIRSTKTLRDRDRTLIIPLYFVKNSCLNVSAMMSVHVNMCPKPDNSPFFLAQIEEWSLEKAYVPRLIGIY